jgi:hypothetical protein
MAKEPKKTVFDRAKEALTDAPPGLMPDGKLNTVKADDPPFEPEIVDDDGDELEPEQGTEADRTENE